MGVRSNPKGLNNHPFTPFRCKTAVLAILKIKVKRLLAMYPKAGNIFWEINVLTRKTELFQPQVSVFTQGYLVMVL